MSLSKARTLSLYGRQTSSTAYNAIMNTFLNRCRSEGLILPKKVTNEFEKRIKNIDTCKSKLDLRDCSLADGHLVILLKILEETHSIIKLELGTSKEGKTPTKVNKIGTLGAEAILKCLKGQLDYAMNTHIDERMEAIFLSSVQFDRGPNIDESLFVEIENVKSFLLVYYTHIYIQYICMYIPFLVLSWPALSFFSFPLLCILFFFCYLHFSVFGFLSFILFTPALI